MSAAPWPQPVPHRLPAAVEALVWRLLALVPERALAGLLACWVGRLERARRLGSGQQVRIVHHLSRGRHAALVVEPEEGA